MGEDRFEAGSGDAGVCGQLFDAAIAKQAPLVDDQYAIGNGFDVADDVGAKENRSARAERAQGVAESQYLQGIEAVGRLIEEQDRRIVHHGGS